MPIVQGFAGIANENEFFGSHYLAEVFKGDIRSLLDKWHEEDEAKKSRAPCRSWRKALRGPRGSCPPAR